MRFTQWMAVLAVLCLTGIGCQESPDGTRQASSTSSPEVADDSAATIEPPAAAVTEFLTAIREGNDRKAALMFTEKARKQVDQLGIEVAPSGSDTASFAVGDVEYLEGGGARVKATWSDFGADGKTRTDDMLWMLRKAPDGWRIAGMAATVFPGEPPLLLDFENLEETLQKLDMIRVAIQQRSQQGEPPLQAQRPGASTATPR